MKKDTEYKDVPEDISRGKKTSREEREPEEKPDAVVITQEHEKTLSELTEYKDRYVRLYAEFENARKRAERDRSEFVKYAGEKLIVEFLDILDDLERSVQAAGNSKDENASFLKGVELVMARIYEMLKRHGVKAIDARGKPFDPNAHEILMQEETQEHADGTVMEVFQKGYAIQDKVVRTVKVKVAVQPSAAGQDNPQANPTQE